MPPDVDLNEGFSQIEILFKQLEVRAEVFDVRVVGSLSEVVGRVEDDLKFLAMERHRCTFSTRADSS